MILYENEATRDLMDVAIGIADTSEKLEAFIQRMRDIDDLGVPVVIYERNGSLDFVCFGGEGTGMFPIMVARLCTLPSPRVRAAS